MNRILLVDDDELFRESVAQMLTGNGYEVVSAEDGRDGMRRLGEEAFDLLVTDMLMPERDGVETIMAVRKAHPDLPIIAMSGGGRRSSTEYLEYASVMGAAYVFQKPFETDRFLAAIRECLMKD